ncbi:unnamed protein product, partial [Staurois parvus]
WGLRAIGDHGAPVSLPKLKKAYEKGRAFYLVGTRGNAVLTPPALNVFNAKECWRQGQTDNSWGPWAIGDHGAPVSLPKLKKAYEKGTRDISWGPLLTPGPRAVPEFPNGQSAP